MEQYETKKIELQKEIEERIKSTEKEIDEVRKKLQKDSFEYLLKWNIIEDGVSLELKLFYYKRILNLIKLKPIEEFMDILRSSISQIEQQLLGNEYYSSISGPWDLRSTSPGSIRLAIVTSNWLREERALSIKILQEIEKWRN